MEKKMENEMETGIIQGLSGLVSIFLQLPSSLRARTCSGCTDGDIEPC